MSQELRWQPDFDRSELVTISCALVTITTSARGYLHNQRVANKNGFVITAATQCLLFSQCLRNQGLLYNLSKLDALLSIFQVQIRFMPAHCTYMHTQIPDHWFFISHPPILIYTRSKYWRMLIFILSFQYICLRIYYRNPYIVTKTNIICVML